VPVWRLFVLGALLLLGRGTALAPAWFQSPVHGRMRWLAVLWGVAASFDKLGVQQRQPGLGGVVFNLAVGLPPAHTRRVQPGKWQPLNGFGNWRQALAEGTVGNCWSTAGPAVLNGCGRLVQPDGGAGFTAVRPCDWRSAAWSTLLSAIAGVVLAGRTRGSLRLLEPP